MIYKNVAKLFETYILDYHFIVDFENQFPKIREQKM